MKRSKKSKRQSQSKIKYTCNYCENKKHITGHVDTSIWSHSLWFTLHNGSLCYPINPTQVEKRKIKKFILGLPVIIPCKSCSKHATQFINKMKSNLNIISSTREHLFKFFVDFHNNVNIMNNKPTVSYEDAYELYSNETDLNKSAYGQLKKLINKRCKSQRKK